MVTKISSPTNPELAIGALCFTSTYLEEAVIRSLNLNNSEIERQIEVAKIKFNTYVKNFAIKEAPYQTSVKNKTVILTDDGIATGSTIKVAILYLKSLQPRSIILAVPVAPLDFSSPDIDQEVIIHKNHTFGSVSSFYDSFAQVENNEVMKILNQSATR